MNRKVFLSHSNNKKDREIVNLLKFAVGELESVYVAEEDLQPGRPLMSDKIKTQIQKCEDFMVLLTHNAVSSDPIRQEIKIARDAGKRIIPIVEDKVSVKDLDVLPEGIEYIRFNRKEISKMENDIERSFKNLQWEKVPEKQTEQNKEIQLLVISEQKPKQIDEGTIILSIILLIGVPLILILIFALIQKTDAKK